MPTELQSEQIFDYGQTGLGILLVIFLGLVMYYLIRQGLIKLHQNNYVSEAMSGILQLILRWVVIIIVVLAALQQVGLQLTSIWAALSAFVVLIGVGFVAVWSVLSNALCSMLLLMFRPFSIGDEIEVIEATGGGGLRGRVVNLNLLYTFIIESNDQNNNQNGNQQAIILVPNNMFFQKTIRRWQGVQTKSLEETIFKDDTQCIKQNAALFIKNRRNKWVKTSPAS